MRKIVIILVAILPVLSCKNEGVIKYAIDLNGLFNDRLKVDIDLSGIKKDSLQINFVVMDPGHAANFTNFGLYCEDFQAFDNTGNHLPVEKKGDNSYIVGRAGELARISYYINDTWDDTINTSNKFASCVGTSFDLEKGFVINGGIYCYSEELINNPVTVKIIVPDHMDISGSNVRTVNDGAAVIRLKNFSELYDNPLLVSERDVSSFKAGVVKIYVSVSNEQDLPLSENFSSLLKPQVEAVARYFGEPLPVKEYYFLFYIKDCSALATMLQEAENFDSETVDRALDIYFSFNGFSASALEHTQSSLFSIPADYPGQTGFEILDYAIHEFIHTFTPKSLNTELIRKFNFSEPRLSRHRWLYEGVTEYFSGMIKLQGNLLTKEQFLNDFLRPKVVASGSFPVDMSFTQFSANANKEPFKQHYSQSYNRGPLLAMLLDIEIIRLTDGQKNLKDVFLTLYHNREKLSITEDNLVDLFVSEVHPDLNLFFERYINGTEKLPIKDAFNLIGIDYEAERAMTIPDIGISAIPLFNFYLVSTSNIEQILPGDKIDINKYGHDLQKIFKRAEGSYVNEGDTVSMTVIRNKKEKVITFAAPFREGIYRHHLAFQTEPQELYQSYRAKWIGDRENNKFPGDRE